MKSSSFSKSKVFFIRGQSVFLDKDLATFYGTNLKVFNRARKRRQELFKGLAFQLTKEEYAEILAIQGLPKKKGHIPWVYTEKAAYKMAFILDTNKVLRVSNLILETFLSVKQGEFTPSDKDSNKTAQIEERLSLLEKQIKGTVINNLNSSVSLIQGDHGKIIHNDIELIMEIDELKKQAQSDSLIAPKLEELIEVIRQGNKEKIIDYVKKTNDLMDVISKTTSAWTLLKTGINLVKVYFGI